MPKNTPEQIIDSPFVRAQRTLTTSTIAPDGGGGGGGGEMEVHTLSGSYHSGTLTDAQAPQFLLVSGGRTLLGNLGVADGITIDGVDISLHRDDLNIHHDKATAGDGISISGQLIAVDLEGTTSGLEFNSGDLRVKEYNGLSRTASGLGLLLRSGMTALSVDASGLYLADAFAGAGLAIAPTTRVVSVNTGAGILITADAVALDPLVAGNGLGFASGVVNVNVSNGLEIVTDNVRVNQGFAFTWTAEHTFNADPQLAANLDFTGGIRNITTAGSDNLNIIPGGDLILNPGGSNVLPGGSIEDDLGDYNRKWRTLFAAELYVETLVAQDVLATIGGRIMVAPTTTLIADVTAGAGQILVKHNNLPNNGYVMLQTAPGGIAQFEVMRISGVAPVEVTGGWRYGISDRALDGTAANIWLAGDAVVSLGNAIGDGYIELTSTKTVHNHFGPTIAIYSRTGTAAWDDVKPTVAMGNLSSFAGYGVDTFGFAVGNDLELDAATGFSGLTADADNGLRLFNTDLYIYDSGTLELSLTSELGLRMLLDEGWEQSQTRYISWHADLDPLSTPTASISSYADASPDTNLDLLVRNEDVDGVSTLTLTARQADDKSAMIVMRSSLADTYDGIIDLYGDFVRVIEKLKVGGSIPGSSTFHVYENTTSTGLSAGGIIEQGGTGDASLHWIAPLSTIYTAGVDQSDGFKFKMAMGSDLAANSFLVHDPSNQYVGIGTVAPLAKLMVVNTASEVARFVSTSGLSASVQGVAYVGIDPRSAANVFPAVRLTAVEATAADLRSHLFIQLRDTTSDVAPVTKLAIRLDGRIGFNMDTPVAMGHFYEFTNATNHLAGVTLEQAGTGDSVLHWIAGGKVYSAGIDNNDGDKWKLTADYDLGGAGNIITFDPATGITTIAGITVGGAGGGEHDAVTAAPGGGITVVAPQILSVDSTVVRTSTLAALDVIAGSGLSGGGALSGDITLNVNLGTGLMFVGDAIAVDAGAVGGVPGTNRVIAGAGLMDAGNDELASNITLNVMALSTGGLEVAANEIHIKRAPISGLETDSTGLWIRRRGPNFTDSGIAMNATDGIYLSDTVAGSGLVWDSPSTRILSVVALSTGGLQVNPDTVQIKLRTVGFGSGMNTSADGLFIQRRSSLATASGIAMTIADGIYLADTVADAGLEWTDSTNRFLKLSLGLGLEFSDATVNAAVRVKLPAGSGLLRDDTGIFLNPSLAGDGLLMASGIIDIVRGDASLIVNANEVHVNLGHTWAWTGAHQHANQSTFNGGAAFAAGVFAFDTAPQVNTDINFIGTPVRNITSVNNLQIVPGGDLVLDPGGSNVLPGGTVEDDLGYYNRKWRTLYAAELYVETLVAQEVMATIGGRIMVTPTNTLTVDVTPAALTITVKNQDPSFVNDSYVLLQSAPSGKAQYEVMKITSAPVTIAGTPATYRYNVARNVDGSNVWPDGIDGTPGLQGNTWLIGDAVVSLGKEVGSGYIDLSSTATVHNKIGPTITIYARHSMANWDDIVPTTSMGNLSGFVDYGGDEFGFAVGNDLTKSPTDPVTPFSGLTADRDDGLRLFNTDLRMYGSSGVPELYITREDGILLLQDDDYLEHQPRAISWMSAIPGGPTVSTITSYTETPGWNHFRLNASRDAGGHVEMDMRGGNTQIILGDEDAGGYLFLRSSETIAIRAPFTVVGPLAESVNGVSVLHVYESTTVVGATAGLTIEQAGSGDPLVQFLVSSAGVETQRWVLGIDNSVAGDPLRISASANLTSAPLLNLTTAGALSVAGPTAIGGIITPASRLHVYESTGSTGASTGITIEQATTGNTGDAAMQFYLSNASQYWSIGIDNSVTGDPFRISPTADLAGGVFFLTTAGALSVPSTLRGDGGLIAPSLRALDDSGLSITDNAGNLGISIADGGAVTLTGAVTISGALALSSTLQVTGAATLANGLTVSSPSAEVARFASTAGGSTSVQGMAYIGLDPRIATSLHPGVRIGAEELDVVDFRTHLHLQTRSGTSDIEPTTKMIILDTGNVGIGMTGPTALLHLYGNGAVAANLGSLLNVQNDGAGGWSTMRVTNDVGGFFQFTSWGSTFGGSSLGTTRAGKGMLIWEGAATDMVMGTTLAGALGFSTNATRRMTILGTGQVGIGESAPGCWLDVSGDGTGVPVVRSTHYGAGAFQFIGRRALTSKAAPAALALGSTVMSIGAMGYTSGGWAANTSAEINVVATEAFNSGTAGKGGAEMQFWVRPNGAAGVAQAMTLYNDSGVAMFGLYTKAATPANLPRPLLIENNGYVTGGSIYGYAISASASRPVSVNGDGTIGFANIYSQTTVVGQSPSTFRPVIVDANGLFSAENIYRHTVGALYRPVYVTDNGTVGGLLPPSARRFKEAIEDVSESVAERFLAGLRPVTFIYKADETRKVQMGLIAEEVEEAGAIEAVQYNDDGEVEGLAYERLIVPIISMIVQLKRQIDGLKAEMRILRGEL